MDNVLKKQTPSNFRVHPPEDANSNLLRNTATQITRYSNLDHIMFIHHYENLKQKTCRKNWITCTTLYSEPTLYDVMLLHFAPHLSYGVYCIVKWNNKVKGCNKTTSCKAFRNAKCYEFYITEMDLESTQLPKTHATPKTKIKKQIRQLHLPLTLWPRNCTFK